MNTKQIDYALELAQVKNFNRAAENLFISQPSLSYQIQALESEIGLALFLRSGRGAEVTPAGEQFFQTLRNIREELKAAIEQGQNFSARYRSAVTIALPMRSCLYYLPEAMKAFEKTHPDVTVMPHFFPFSDFSSFLKGEEDLIFAMAGDAKGIPDVHSYPLFDSRIYLITKKDDPLAGKDIVRPYAWRPVSLTIIMVNLPGRSSTARRGFPASFSLMRTAGAAMRRISQKRSFLYTPPIRTLMYSCAETYIF